MERLEGIGSKQKYPHIGEEERLRWRVWRRGWRAEARPSNAFRHSPISDPPAHWCRRRSHSLSVKIANASSAKLQSLHEHGPTTAVSFICMYALQFSFASCPKTLILSGPPPPGIPMKDRPPPSCVSRYIPPHHRLRSAVVSSASPNLTAASPDSKSRGSQSTLLNPRNTSPPYSQPQKLPQKDNSPYDFVYEEVPEEGSDREIESSSHEVSWFVWLFVNLGLDW